MVSSALQIENVRLFDDGMVRMRAQVLKVAQTFSEQWECLKIAIPDLAILLRVCNENSKNILDCAALYCELKSLNNTS